MPVYQNKYTTWNGEYQPIFKRLLSFPRYSYMQLLGKRMVHMVFVSAWLPFILFTVYIYARVNVKLMESFNIPIGRLWEVDARFFYVFLWAQVPFLLFFTIMVGPSLMSRDIRHKALPMILSKPISRWEYILGKYMVLFFLLSILSWFQGFLLFFFQTSAVSKFSTWRMEFWSESFWLLPKIFIFSLLTITTLNLLVMALSCLTQNYRFASTAIIMIIIGGFVVGGVATGIFRSHNWMCISTMTCLASIGYQVFGLKNQTGLPSGLAWLSILGLWGICILILSWKTRAFQRFRE